VGKREDINDGGIGVEIVSAKGGVVESEAVGAEGKMGI
jgi:hypothetical protein